MSNGNEPELNHEKEEPASEPVEAPAEEPAEEPVAERVSALPQPDSPLTDVNTFAEQVYNLAMRSHVPLGVYSMRMADATLDIVSRGSLMISVTRDHDPGLSTISEDDFLAKITQEICKDIPSNDVLHLFHDRYESTYLEFVNSFSAKPSTIMCMLKRVMEMHYSHAYCYQTKKIIEFHYTADYLEHKIVDEPIWYAKKYDRWLKYPRDPRANEIVVDLLMFRESDRWKTWTFLGLFRGLPAVKQEIRRKDLQWSHCFCPATNHIYNFHYEKGKMSMQIKESDAEYLGRVESYVKESCSNK